MNEWKNTEYEGVITHRKHCMGDDWFEIEYHAGKWVVHIAGDGYKWEGEYDSLDEAKEATKTMT